MRTDAFSNILTKRGVTSSCFSFDLYASGLPIISVLCFKHCQKRGRGGGLINANPVSLLLPERVILQSD